MNWMDIMKIRNDELETKYLCPLCLKRGWKRYIYVEMLDGDNWHWRCTYIKCAASDDWQRVLEPILDKNWKPKIGYEK